MFAVIKAKSGPTMYNIWLFWFGSKLQMIEYKKNNQTKWSKSFKAPMIGS